MFTPTTVGDYDARFTVTDSDGGSNTQSTLIRVTTAAPLNVTIDNVPGTNPLENDTVNLGSTHDSGEPTQTYSWTITRGGQVFQTGSNATIDFMPDDNGVYEISLDVVDAITAGSATATITVDNVAPTVTTPGSGASNEGAAFSASGSFSDPG